ncbi:hypothetical protein SAMN05444920_103606 [Nonomuraea solani]|uniref:WxL domain surface cell wall-binding n=1 Tax=Nonomuraea solani TaxID=1144553 RepID=A0A1H6BSE8_9ACTN|nr:hypothetical protein [Nonomuraea solani]SEG63570.1 hypothetical protein SAMN05444920_103606 [Nonomuraea solani]
MSTLKLRRAAVVMAGMALALGSLAGPALADVSATGPQGQTLTAAKAEIDPAGESIRVTGTGYDIGKGIYLALCVSKGAGQVATPCVGGIDMTGQSHGMYWISSNPPPYGVGIAKPYTDEGGGKGGFDLNLDVKAVDDQGTDCRAAGVQCVVYTRADHTRGGDRTQDVQIPVTWKTGGGNPDPGTDPVATADQTLSVDVTGGALSLSVAGDAVALSAATVGGTATGQMNAAKVTDQRGSSAGWSLVGQVGDFSGDAGTIPAAQLGWTPTATGDGVTAGGVVQPGTGFGTAAALCSAPTGKGAGASDCGAALKLGIPGGTKPGGYSATLTLTLS